jgi:DNA (cytosine-5)-methyltransferase 1
MSKNEHLFPYEWRLSDGYPAKGITHHGCKVFGTFICGGGSTMGYKLAGYDHLGGVELDPKVAATYKANHHPRFLYVEDIRDFNKREDLPAELYQLDLLDGSPPCSTFSMAGSREKAWGKEKHFAEGQKLQRLDDLVFVYCDTIAKLNPKVCILENVSGLVKGNGKAYAKEIVRRMTSSGYRVQAFLLDASTMGVPQRRERCFFIGLRNDYKLPPLHLDFCEQPIVFREIKDNSGAQITGELTRWAWENKIPSDKNIGDTNKRLRGKNSNFNTYYLKDEQVPMTWRAAASFHLHYSEPLMVSKTEYMKIGSFPLDYQGDNIGWLVGWYERAARDDGANQQPNLFAMAFKNH